MPNRNVDAEVRACVDSFVADLTAIVQRSTVESVLAAVSQGLGEMPGPAAAARTRRKTKKKASRGPGRPRKKRGRRSSADVDSMMDEAQAFIRANPGCSVGDIGDTLGASTKDLRLPLLKLVDEGRVRTTGQKRGTRYHPGSGKRRGGRKVKRKTSGRKKKASRKKTGRKKG